MQENKRRHASAMLVIVVMIVCLHKLPSVTCIASSMVMHIYAVTHYGSFLCGSHQPKVLIHQTFCVRHSLMKTAVSCLHQCTSLAFASFSMVCFVTLVMKDIRHAEVLM